MDVVTPKGGGKFSGTGLREAGQSRLRDSSGSSCSSEKPYLSPATTCVNKSEEQVWLEWAQPTFFDSPRRRSQEENHRNIVKPSNSCTHQHQECNG
eukprot:c14706_g1_i1 orf=119-406(-)